ncbi:hypothetical protein IU11_12740 [Cellulosimicrobium sp. MM]|nr:hypothetical protein IU11_12740 [Cellulosimicrobium sp. MM]
MPKIFSPSPCSTASGLVWIVKPQPSSVTAARPLTSGWACSLWPRPNVYWMLVHTGSSPSSASCTETVYGTASPQSKTAPSGWLSVISGAVLPTVTCWIARPKLPSGSVTRSCTANRPRSVNVCVTVSPWASYSPSASKSQSKVRPSFGVSASVVAEASNVTSSGASLPDTGVAEIAARGVLFSDP